MADKKMEFKNLDEKLQHIKREICIAKKNGEGYGYTYVTEESLLLKVNELMLSLGIRLIPKVVPNTSHCEPLVYKDKKGNECTDTTVRADMVYMWKDIDTGETEEVSWALFGQQSDASQAFGSGLTYSNRYFILKYFNVATSNDDPDKIRSKQLEEQAEAEEKKKMSASQTKIKKLFSECVAKFGGNRETYAALGTTANDFSKDMNKPERQDILIEQMELALGKKKEDSNA